MFSVRACGWTVVLALAVYPALGSSAPGATHGGEEPAAARARRLLLEGDAEGAAELFAKQAATDPEDAASRAWRVRSLIVLDRWQEALAEARRFTTQLPAAPAVRSALGEALYRAGRLDEADSVLSALVQGQDAETPPRAWVTLGKLRSAQGDVRVAVTYLNHALELAPQDRYVLRETAGAAATRREIVERLERYLAASDGDEPDRIEAARGKIALYEALGERPVWVVQNRPERLEVPLAPLGDGVGNVIGYVVEVAIGSGRPVRLLLDSGSTGLYLLERIARKHGFEPLAKETVFGGGGGGRHVSPRGLFPSLAVGDLRFSDALATTTRQEIEPHGRFHGLLGLSTFDGYRVVLDLAGGRLILDRSEEPADGQTYWDVGGQLLVDVTTSAGTGGLFLLDTGATWTTVSLALVRESPGAALGESLDVRGFGGRLRGTQAVRGLSLEFQGFGAGLSKLNARDLSLRSHLGDVEVSGLLGLDLLAGHRLVLDTRSQRVRLLEPEPESKPSKRKRK